MISFNGKVKSQYFEMVLYLAVEENVKYFENYMKGACEKIADKTIQYDGRYCDVQSMAKKFKGFYDDITDTSSDNERWNCAVEKAEKIYNTYYKMIMEYLKEGK